MRLKYFYPITIIASGSYDCEGSESTILPVGILWVIEIHIQLGLELSALILEHSNLVLDISPKKKKNLVLDSHDWYGIDKLLY